MAAGQYATYSHRVPGRAQAGASSRLRLQGRAYRAGLTGRRLAQVHMKPTKNLGRPKVFSRRAAAPSSSSGASLPAVVSGFFLGNHRCEASGAHPPAPKRARAIVPRWHVQLHTAASSGERFGSPEAPSAPAMHFAGGRPRFDPVASTQRLRAAVDAQARAQQVASRPAQGFAACSCQNSTRRTAGQLLELCAHLACHRPKEKKNLFAQPHHEKNQSAASLRAACLRVVLFHALPFFVAL